GVGDVKVSAADHPEQRVRAQAGQGRGNRLGDPHQGRSTRARARHGLPEPPLIGSGPASTTAPRGGSRARFCSWVSPYLPAPSSDAWQGNGGSKECAAPASVPTVSTPSPISSSLVASHCAQAT